MITEASIHVRKLELDLQSAKASVKNLLPLYLKYIKIDENSPAAVIFMVMAAQGVISMLVPGVNVSFEDIQKLRKAQENVDALEKQLVNAREKLVNLTAAAKNAQSEDAQWLLFSVQLGGLLARISDVEPSLSVLTRIADAVDSECQEYLTFLNNKEDVQVRFFFYFSDGSDQTKKS
ncbi:hypothetical protein BDZ94DRAFT_1253788 [Collybia nuda]|uniref:Uncharacterized protein n=1 Tax=Collybia nuda TaxID=64659 RepID=A0A9P5YBK9_9AGAR|nr:hypothetical protein BDZ94DRAFT_1253788 [Collybia nuda]